MFRSKIIWYVIQVSYRPSTYSTIIAKLAEFLETPIACKVSKIKASELHAQVNNRLNSRKDDHNLNSFFYATQLIRVTDELTIGDKHDAMQELEGSFSYLSFYDLFTLYLI